MFSLTPLLCFPRIAGKTLVGITAACTVKKNTLILCTNALSVEQWANELRHWSSIKAGQIAKFTADQKARFSGDGTRLAVITKCHLAGIVISTYTMIAHSGKRAWETQQMLSFINSVDWGLMILDEVHVVPANVFRRVLTTVAAHTKYRLFSRLPTPFSIGWGLRQRLSGKTTRLKTSTFSLDQSYTRQTGWTWLVKGISPRSRLPRYGVRW